MFTKAKPRSPKSKPAKILPIWATKTESDIAYCLQMEDSGGEHLEAIYDLSRAEYAALKLYLAGMRRLEA